MEKEAAEKGQDERRKKALARAEALKPKLGQLVVVVPKMLSEKATLRVDVDGAGLDSTQWGSPQPVDKGKHTIGVKAQGKLHWEQAIETKDGEIKVVSIDDFVKLPDKMPPEDLEQSGEPMAGQKPEGPEQKGMGRPFPIWQVAVGAAGLAAIGGGIAFKMDSQAAEKSLVAHCGADLKCPRDGGYDPSDDNASKNQGFAGFVALTGLGVLAVGASVTGLLLFWPKEKPPKTAIVPVIMPGAGGVVATGRF